MKMLQEKEKEEARNDRKFIKSQVEKRRRERINRSLERLRTMLLQEPQQTGGAQHRVEKAEILERTVLFLQTTAGRDKAKAAGGGKKHSFHDGFSACLQRASRFLGPEGKGLWLGAALDASFAARSGSAAVQKRVASSLPHAKFILQLLRQKSKCTPHAPASGANGLARPYQEPEQQGGPAVQQGHLRQDTLEIGAASQAGKPSPSQGYPDSQTLWRPWPLSPKRDCMN